MRKRLRELLLECGAWGANMTTSGIANHLIANDVVPVVRCKDCKRYSQSGLCNLYLNVSHEMKPDDFCSYGERRGGE